MGWGGSASPWPRKSSSFPSGEIMKWIHAPSKTMMTLCKPTCPLWKALSTQLCFYFRMTQNWMTYWWCRAAQKVPAHPGPPRNKAPVHGSLQNILRENPFLLTHRWRWVSGGNDLGIGAFRGERFEQQRRTNSTYLLPAWFHLLRF